MHKCRTLIGLDNVLNLYDAVFILKHNERLVVALKQFQEVGVTFNKDNVSLLNIKYISLGHSSGQDGIQVDAERIKAAVQPRKFSDLFLLFGGGVGGGGGCKSDEEDFQESGVVTSLSCKSSGSPRLPSPSNNE